MAYPVSFNIQAPTEEFDKAQIALRLLLIFVIYWIFSGVIGAVYFLFPVFAAVMISQKGAETYLAEAEEGPVKWLRYIMGFYAYISLATDKLPTENPEEVVDLAVQPTGSPTVGDALLRIILVIPHAIVLSILGIAFFVVWVIAVFSVLFSGEYPDWAFNFIRGYLRWYARVLAYLASLVDEYPPFSFEDDGGEAPAAGPPPSEPAE